MKPELQSILDAIGYRKACRYNPSLRFQLWEPRQRSYHLFADKVEARECLEQLQNVSELISDMSPRLLELINDHCKTSDDWDEGREPFVEIVQAITELEAMARNESNKYWKGRGASRRLAGENIAKRMAEIFVLGTGKKPGSGADDDGNPSGLFPRAVREVFALIGIPDNFRRPCKKAVAWLNADDQREYHRLLRMRENKGRRVSLFGTDRK